MLTKEPTFSRQFSKDSLALSPAAAATCFCLPTPLKSLKQCLAQNHTLCSKDPHQGCLSVPSFPPKKQEEGCLPVWTWARLLKASEKITSRTQITLGSMVAMPFSSLLPGDSESGVRICLIPRF